MSGPRIKSTNILTKNQQLGYAFMREGAAFGYEGVGSYLHFWETARFFGTLEAGFSVPVIRTVKLPEPAFFDSLRDLLKTIKYSQNPAQALEKSANNRFETLRTQSLFLLVEKRLFPLLSQ